MSDRTIDMETPQNKTGIEPEPRSGSLDAVVRRPGYNYCEAHNQEYLEYCCGCALDRMRPTTGNIFRDAMANNRGIHTNS